MTVTCFLIIVLVACTVAQPVQYWRSDWKCGPEFTAPNGEEAKCRANCCSESGWCGDSSVHCISELYKDYRCCTGESECPESCEIDLTEMVATQSSEYSGNTYAGRAIDGNTAGHTTKTAGLDTCTHTGLDLGAWWMVDLGKNECIRSVLIYNRQDCCAERLSSAVVRIGSESNRNNPTCRGTVPGTTDLISMSCNLEGRYISIHLPNNEAEHLTLCEVRAFVGNCEPEIELIGKRASQSMTFDDSEDRLDLYLLSSHGSSDIFDTLLPSSWGLATANKAIDGDTSGHVEDQSCSITHELTGAWWMVDLQEQQCVGTVLIHTAQRCDNCWEHLNGAVIRVGNDPRRNNPSCDQTLNFEPGTGHMISEVTCNLEGRYLSVTISGRAQMFLCEVRAAVGECEQEIDLVEMNASQSSTGEDRNDVLAPAQNAIDNNTNSSCSHTGLDHSAWWMLDMGVGRCIGKIEIYNRQDCCQERLVGATIRIGNNPKRHNPFCSTPITRAQIEGGHIIAVECNLVGRYISIALMGTETLTLCEVRAFQGDCTQGEFCRASIDYDDTYGWLEWPKTDPQTMIRSDVLCAENTTKAGQPVAYRYCNLISDPVQPVGKWGPIEYLECDYSVPDDKTSHSENEYNCLGGWDTYGQYCYYFANATDQKTFDESVEACHDMDSNLTSIHTLEEQDYHIMRVGLTESGMSRSMWIGLHNTTYTANQFEWIDSTPLNYARWSYQAVNNSHECVQLSNRYNGYWEDYPCAIRLGYICKKLATLQTEKAMMCLPDVAQGVDELLTWPETAVGETAFSDETCSLGTFNAGYPLAVRHCSLSTSSQVQWDSVRMLGCSEKETSEKEQVSEYCPEAWDANGQFCYYVNLDLVTFSEAEVACRNLDSNLTSIHSLEEQMYLMFVYRKMTKQLWIGLHDKTNETAFEWIDGTPLDYESWSQGQPDNYIGAEDYESWSQGQPDNYIGAEDCAHLWEREGGNWNDGPCDQRLGYICKKPKGVKEGYCTSDVTVLEAGSFTWPETFIGDTALSEETCGHNTDYSGRAVAARYCKSLQHECTDGVKHVNPNNPNDETIMEQCPTNWEGYSGSCYFTSTDKLSFHSGQAICQQYDANLASVHSVGEQVFIQGLLTSRDIYDGLIIGLHDTSVENEFEWIDGTPVDYVNWSEHEPNNWGTGEDCGMLFGSERDHLQGWWNDVPCTLERHFICMKRATCEFSLGMESGRISDDQISASSVYDSQHLYTRARLNQPTDGWFGGAWTAAPHAHNQQQWIQVEFVRETVVTAVITQGRADEDQWVEQYTVEYTQDGSSWNYIYDSSTRKLFSGNTDQTTPVTQQLPRPISVIAIKIRPMEWHKYMSMRFELLGCIAKADTCPADSIFGWSISNRGTRLDNEDLTYVFPEKEVPCDGLITNWLFWSRIAEPFRAIVWRKTANERYESNRFQIVGINEIPRRGVNRVENYTVPITERFSVVKGDLLGFAFRRSSLAFQIQRADTSRVLFLNVPSPYSMAAGETYIVDGKADKVYSLAAIVSPTTSESNCQQYQTTTSLTYEYQYVWPQIPNDVTMFTFKLRAQNDGHISLAPSQKYTRNLVEIVLGGWRNQQSAIRTCEQCRNSVKVNTANLLSTDRDEHFFISFKGGLIKVGIVGQLPFMWYQIQHYLNINFIGISTGFGSTGKWTFCGFSKTCNQKEGKWDPVEIMPCSRRATNHYPGLPCPAIETSNEVYGAIVWPESSIGTSVKADVTCGISTAKAGQPVAFRSCERGSDSLPEDPVGEWGDVIYLECEAPEPTLIDEDPCHSYHTTIYGYHLIQNENFEFVWPKLASGTTAFNVFIRAPNDVYLILSPTKTGVTNDNVGDSGITKILIGGGSNTFSGVMCSSVDGHSGWDRFNSPNILNPNDFKEFHVSFANDILEVSLAGEEPFIHHDIGCPKEVNYIGITSGYGSNADWKYCTSTCQPGWELFGSFCYHIETEQRGSFSHATDFCQRLGGNLTSIHSTKEQTYHSELERKAGEALWIGLHDITDEGHFEWIDGTPLNYESWASSQPDDWHIVGGQDCGHLNARGTWDDQPCSLIMAFICKQQQIVNAGHCVPGETYTTGGVITWAKTEARKTAFSSETCGVNTDNSGLPLGTRYCRPTSEWGNVQMLRCYDEMPTVAVPVTVPYGSSCASENSLSEFGVLSWPRTYAGEAAFSLEVCPSNTQHHGSPIAFRVCLQGDPSARADLQGTWGPEKIVGCQDPVINITAPQLTESDIEAVSRKLEHFTQTMGVANLTEVHAVSWMVANIASVESPSPKVLESITQAVNTLLESVDPSLRKRQSTDLSTSTSDIVRALEQQVSVTMLYQDEFNLVQSALVVAGVSISNNVEPVRFDVYESSSDDERQFVSKKLGDNPWETPVVSIQIPSEAIILTKDATNVSAGFIAYQDDFLFRSNRLTSESLVVTGPIIATTMESSNLSEPVIIKIKERPNADSNDVFQGQSGSVKCVFWDFKLANGIGDWSEEGCVYVDTNERVTTCHCSHLSTFAVLREAPKSKTSALKIDNTSVMSPGTKIAISVALIAVILTLLVFVLSRRLRESKSYHAIGNVCGAIFILYLTFAAGIDATDNSTGCILVAAMLHYFSLVSLLWLAVEIRNSNGICSSSDEAQQQVQIGSMVKAYAASWGIPAVVVGLTMTISFADYQNAAYCAVSAGPALFYGTVIPMLLIVIHNVITFIFAFLAVRHLPFTSDAPAERGTLKNHGAWQRAQASLVVSVVFTISVCFAYLHLINPSTIALRAFFSISVAATGLIVLGMFCLYLDDVRRAVLPKTWQREYPEMMVPISFQNVGYDGEGEHADTVEIPATKS